MAAGANTQVRRYAALLAAMALVLAGALGFAAYSGWQTEQQKQREVVAIAARGVAGTIDLALSRVERSLAQLAERLAIHQEKLAPPPGTLIRELQWLRATFPALDGVGVVDARGAVIDSAAGDPRLTAVLAPAERWPPGDPKLAIGGLMITAPATPFSDGVARLALWHSILGSDGRVLGAVYCLIPTGRVVALLRGRIANPNLTIDVLRADRLVFLISSSQALSGAPLPDGALRDLLIAGDAMGTARTNSVIDGAPTLTAFEVSPRYGVIAMASTTISAVWAAWVAEHRIQIGVFVVFFVTGLAFEVWLFAALRRGLQAELRLRATNETAFQDSIRNLDDGFALWDRDHRLLVWNQRFVDAWPELRDHVRVGMSFEAATRAVLERHKPTMSAAALDAHVRERMAAHREIGAKRFDRRMPDGRVIEVVKAPTSDGRVVSTYRDVTELRSLVERLARSEARVRDGIESMEEGFALWDRDDYLVLWNRRYVEILPHMRGLVREGIHFRDLNLAAFSLVQPGLTPEAVAALVDARVAHRKASALRTIDLPDGRIVEVKDLPTSEGGMVSIHRDVTERNRRQAELHRALAAEQAMNAEQRRFITVTSHEYRTPLMIIDGAAQRLVGELPVDAGPKLMLRVNRIRNAVSRMVAILERTHFAAQIDVELTDLELRPIDLGGLLESVCARQRLISPQVAIRLSLPAEPLLVEGDRSRLDMVFTNLVTNAVNFSGAVPQIEIVAGAADGMAEIAVRDHGIGIPADEIDKLFVRFFRASTAMGITGTGIGLHLVKSLVERHAGTVAVASEVGRGSTFTVRLPGRQPQDSTGSTRAA